MRVFGRIIIILLLAIMVIISGIALVCALGLVRETQFNIIADAFYNSLGTRTIVAAASVFVILLTALTAVAGPYRKKFRSSHVMTSYDGSIKISHLAIIDLIKSMGKREAGVAKTRVRIRNTKAGMQVLVIMTLKRSANIRSLTQKIKKETVEFLVEQCGVKLAEMEVVIDRVIGKI